MALIPSNNQLIIYALDEEEIMGFVVTVSMLLILLMSVPNPFRVWLQKRQGELALWALLAGMWNFAWHGSQHLGEFWGNAAFISGLLMVFTSMPLLKVDKWPSTLKTMVQTYQTACPKTLHYLALFALAICAALYSYTLIKLNLG
ncbi:hypothetical protein [Marinomonas primoryensis]|uniref:hypothetical protein n=1 Tax=Marinomonas primoryensis TaxID=178399 RepID=UPI0037037757